MQEEEFPVAIRDLHPFYSYQFTVAAVTVKPGPFSDEVACTLPEDGMVIFLGGHKVNSQYCHCVGMTRQYATVNQNSEFISVIFPVNASANPMIRLIE